MLPRVFKHTELPRKTQKFLDKNDQLCQISLVATPGVQSLLPQKVSGLQHEISN